MKKHPVVQAKNNLIDVDLKSNIDYYAPLYVGSSFSLNHVVIDTTTSQTVIVGQNTKGGNQVPANYLETESETKAPIYTTSRRGTEEQARGNINLGSKIFNGDLWKEYMCLMQAKHKERKFSTGKYCVADFQFLLATTINGKLNANGVLGFGPGGGNRSFVRALKMHG